ncbi:sodium-coupled neutral amino acid transporter [Achlya hypogyna]|uniref:Sodium-coupled neutral amino acid transporter n=1 Tax=Achlya hypogyna TaxID=1202772 RepID=A0A1V9ZI05_ACHHY|nr:sodium-coupled neutral amino acid transporter [Achlya hypogyna]
MTTTPGVLGLKSPNLFQYEAEKKSYEFFYPSPHSSARQATAKSSIMNLVTTLIGGGVLLLPYTIARSGIVLGCILMFCCAMGSSFTSYILVSCSRRSGAQSYEEIAKNAFGKRMQIFTMVLLILLIFLAFVGYVILVRDIAGSLASQFIFGRALSVHDENLVAMALIGLVSPLLFLQSMNALRYTSILGLCTVGVFAIGIFFRAIQKINGPTFDASTLKYAADNVEDPMYALPIIISSFLCHFNVIPVYHELHKPTRRRLKRVVVTTVFSTSFFYMVIGTLGYIYAYEQPLGVQGDILNNFDRDDTVMNIGRCGILTTICFSLPLLILPCRRTLYRLIQVVRESWSAVEHNENQPLLATPADDSTEKPIPLVPHVVMTLVLLAMAFYLAFSLPGVAVVWNIMGSTVGILISYVLPSVCYLRIRREKPNSDWRKIGAWVLLAISGSLFLYCSALAFYKMGSMAVAAIAA